jgi:hypothetical protein
MMTICLTELVEVGPNIKEALRHIKSRDLCIGSRKGGYLEINTVPRPHGGRLTNPNMPGLSAATITDRPHNKAWLRCGETLSSPAELEIKYIGGLEAILTAASLPTT